MDRRPEPLKKASSRTAELCGLALLLVVFALLLWQVESGGWLTAVDASLQAALAAWRQPGILTVASWLTWLGSPYVIAGLTLAATLLLSLRRAWPALAGLWLAVVGAGLSILAVKAWVERPRPEALEGLAVASSSFPSGNSVLAAALFGGIALFCLSGLRQTSWQGMLRALAIALPLLVALSRVVLSAHWLSDVIAGLCLGAAWALLGSLLAARQQRPAEAMSPNERRNGST